jgi:hypothetical protein
VFTSERANNISASLTYSLMSNFSAGSTDELLSIRNRLLIPVDQGATKSGHDGKSVQRPPLLGFLEAVHAVPLKNLANIFPNSIRCHHVDGVNLNRGYDAIAVTRFSEIPGSLTWEQGNPDPFLILI